MPGSAPRGRNFLTAQRNLTGDWAVGPIPILGKTREVAGGIRCHLVRFLRVKCIGPGKSVFSAPRGWKALDFLVVVTAAESGGPARSQCALTPALPPLLHRSRTRSIPRRLLLSVARAGEKRGELAVGKGAGAARGRNGEGAGEAGGPGPRAEEGERGPRRPGSLGYHRVRSWLQTLASRMPSVDERCIVE